MTSEIKGRHFYLDNKKTFINSGEIHYFRIRRELWDRHLDEAVRAGLNAVSTYIPWAWHEEEEGVFDFDGLSCPEKDLRGWLRSCREHGLFSIVKPGPFILAEFRGAGLPDWFLSRYGDQVYMRNSKDEKVVSEGVSLFNDRYLEKVSIWYDRIMPLIASSQASSGGPVIMMQVCNEIGVFTWLARQGDYGNKVRERFISYISQKYDNIEEVNELWETDFRNFNDIELPPDGQTPYVSSGDRGRDYEWHCFWRRYYGDYLRLLVSMVRERGVTVPLYHNLPGWIYGNGYEFPVNITMYEDLFNDRSELLFGVDHIPEFVSYRNMHDDRIINDISRAMQGRGPLFAAEFQSGSREFQVVTNPREMELFYKASIANGLTGWNYYMFSQGRNVPRKGFSGDTFYWFTPLTAEGERTNAYAPVEKMSRIISVCSDIIVEADRRAEVCVLFYPPYYATELERPAGEACGLRFVPSAIRRAAYFDGLLRVLQVLNIDYDMADLNTVSPDELSGYKQVWAFATDEMDEAAQQTIVDYVSEGGNAVIYPYLPDRDMSQRPCTVLRDAVAVSPSGTEVTVSPLVDILASNDVKCSNPQAVFSEESLSGSEIIARTINGAPCGFAKPLGKGVVTHLGTWIGFDTAGHKPVYEAILERSGAVLRHAWSDNENITVRERFAGGRAMLFIANYYNEGHTGSVSYTHPETGETIRMPMLRSQTDWPPLYGILTPVCLQVTEGLKILHATSDILDFKYNGRFLQVILSGDRDMTGEIVFEGLNAAKITSANISGRSLEIIRTGERTLLAYEHEHRKEIVLTIEISQ